MSGGQILNTYEVDNYPGIPGVGGFDLEVNSGACRCRRMSVCNGRSVRDQKQADHKVIVTDKGNLSDKDDHISQWCDTRTLGVPGEEELMGMGVSYCATRDGAFFKERQRQ